MPNPILYVSYTSSNEVLVMTPEMEPKMLIEFFGPKKGRSLDDYDRTDHYETEGSAVMITSQMTAR